MAFALSIASTTTDPLYIRLADSLRNGIDLGRWRPGEYLPSVRELSVSLRISRSTVLKSIDLLQTEGLLDSRIGSGVRVVSASIAQHDFNPINSNNSNSSSKYESEQEHPNLAQYASKILEICHNRKTESIPDWEVLNHALAPQSVSAIRSFNRCLVKYAHPEVISRFKSEGNSLGIDRLRLVMGEYLGRARKVSCSLDQLLVFSCKQLRADTLARLIIDQGDYIAVEDPGCPAMRELFLSHGARIIPIPVDENGIDTQYLFSQSFKFKAVYLTPSHQNPTGAVLSTDRRHALIQWARANDTYLIEDDYGSEYRYGSGVLPSLQGLDNGSCVIYFPAAFQMLHQASTLSALIVPAHLSRVASLARLKVERDLSTIEQLALYDFIEQGHLERHLRRSQMELTRRRQACILSLTSNFGRMVRIAKGGSGGLLLIRLHSDACEADVLRHALSVGLALRPSSGHYLDRRVMNEYLLAFSNLSAEDAERKIANWAMLISGLGIAPLRRLVHRPASVGDGIAAEAYVNRWKYSSCATLPTFAGHPAAEPVPLS